MSELLSTVDHLVNPHTRTIDTVDGFESHEQPGLLAQLRDAVFGGMEKTGGSAGSKAKLPLSEAAADLHDLIDRQIAEAWAATFHRSPGMSTTAQLVTQWAAAVAGAVPVVVTHPEQHDKWDPAKGREVPFVVRAREEYLPLELARHWVTLIEDFLNPESTAGIKAPCLQCGASKVSRRKDGEAVLTDAMVFRRDRDTGRTLDARCLNCGVIWLPSQFEFLAEALGITMAVAP